jgi:hypothetical protein
MQAPAQLAGRRRETGSSLQPAQLPAPETFRGRFAPVFGFLVAYLSTLVEAAETGPFSSGRTAQGKLPHQPLT